MTDYLPLRYAFTFNPMVLPYLPGILSVIIVKHNPQEVTMNTRKSMQFVFAVVAGLSLAIMALSAAYAATTDDEVTVDLAITLKAPAHVAVDSQFTLNLAYANLGTSASPGDTWVQVTLPAGVAFVAAASQDGQPIPPDEIDGNILLWQVGSIPAGSCWEHIWITLHVDPNLPEETALPVTAEAGSSATDTDPDNNQAVSTSEVCDMAGSTHQAQVRQAKPGDEVLYTITLQLAQRNDPGATNQREVILTGILPPAEQARFLGWVGPVEGIQEGQTLRWQGRLRAGEPLQLQYRLGIEGDVPPGTGVVSRAQVSWTGGQMPLESSEVLTYLDPEDHMFGPGGGQSQYSYGVTLDVPPHAVTETTRFQFRPLFTLDPPPDVPPGWQFAHRAFELTAFQYGELHRFNQPITITVHYDHQNVAGLDPYTLRLWYRNTAGEPWAMLGEPSRYQNGQVSFQTDHFTEFVLLGQSYRLFLPGLHK
jgi:Domain of unknown function DUF11